jgi:hypothetical protein
MSNPLSKLTFEAWLLYVFDHPVPKDQQQAWYWDTERDWWEENPADALHFMTQAFENAQVVFEPYSDAQLNQGLWFLVSNACSNHMFALMDESQPWSMRQRCVVAMHQLYEQCFAKRCSPHLSHVDEPGANPLNLVCYMWWDLMPIYGMPDNPAHKELDKAILQVMESSLQLDSIPCRESALHGLGHWQSQYPERVGQIIDKFSMQQPELPTKLHAYMINAYRGHVL